MSSHSFPDRVERVRCDCAQSPDLGVGAHGRVAGGGHGHDRGGDASVASVARIANTPRWGIRGMHLRFFSGRG